MQLHRFHFFRNSFNFQTFQSLWTQVAKWRLRLPHFSSDVVAPSQLVAEALALRVDHQATHAAQGLSSQEFDLGLGVIRLYQASGQGR